MKLWPKISRQPARNLAIGLIIFCGLALGIHGLIVKSQDAVEIDPFELSPGAQKVLENWEKDQRNPTLADLGGLWSTGRDFTGFKMRIDQKGRKLRGEGFIWTCIPPYPLCRIEGRIDGGEVELKIHAPERSAEVARFELTEEDGMPILKPVGEKNFIGTMRTHAGNLRREQGLVEKNADGLHGSHGNALERQDAE